MIGRVKTFTLVRRGPGRGLVLGWLKAGSAVLWDESENGWLKIGSARWISAMAVKVENAAPFPYDPPTDGLGDVWLTITGAQKPRVYHPQGINFGSFDIGWLLAGQRVTKPDRIKLDARHISYILRLNDGDVAKLNWLIAQDSNKKVLSVEGDHNYSIPVPCFSGNNFVRVLEMSGPYAKIETIDVHDGLPENPPPWLVHTWWAFTKGGSYFQPFGAIGGVKYPLFANDSFAWILKSALARKVV